MSDRLLVLVVDDNEDDRAMYRRALTKAFGDRVHFAEAASGDGALGAIAGETPQCVLLDYSLPGHNGIQVLKRIRVQHPHLPVILLTGQGNEGLAVQSMKEGAQDYITKGAITPESLGLAVRSSIANNALKRRIDEQIIASELFTHALAHDLKEPLRSICWFTEMITEDDLSRTDLRNYIRLIHDAGERMVVLIDTVLSYVQLDARAEPEHVNFGLEAALRAAEANLFVLLQQRGVALDCAALPDVFGNKIQITQLLQNLLSNAASYCEPPVKISIAADSEGEMVRVAVQDNGPGIAPEYLEQIFQPFRRLNRDNAHCGLGLAICQKIAEAHGGQIICESPRGEGARFVFYLPKAKAPPVLERKTAAISTAAATHSRIANLLWIDDREDDLLIGREMLTRRQGLKCNISFAYDGREGIAMIRNRARTPEQVDLVLLDINMPVMDGFETLERLKSEPDLTAIPVIMCSGSIRERDKERALALGAVGYLEKPPILEHLRRIVDTIQTVRLAQTEADQPVLIRLPD